MSRPRIHVPAGRWAGRVALNDDERHRLVEVLRLGEGANVEVFDGEGGLAHATLVRDTGWMLVLAHRKPCAQRGPRLHLGMALLKGKKLDLVVRMATELGVASIAPYLSQRSIPRPDGARLKRRLMRWRALASEAARQSGRATIPPIEPFRTVAEILEMHTAAARAMLDPAAAGPTLTEFLRQSPAEERFVLVGPEGGFSPEEVEAAREAGFALVRLDLPVLRAETAAVAAATLAGSAETSASRPDPPAS